MWKCPGPGRPLVLQELLHAWGVGGGGGGGGVGLIQVPGSLESSLWEYPVLTYVCVYIYIYIHAHVHTGERARQRNLS